MTSSAYTTPRQAILRRTAASAVESDSSAVVSPSNSPRPSASSTSLSSLSSVEVSDNGKLKQAPLLDTYGNSFSPPDFSIKDIRDAIPRHCFERSALKGYGYILRDLVCLATTFTLWHTLVRPEYIPWTIVRAILWALYTFVQGLFGTGLWVIAHECGHGAFSSSRVVNDVTGWLIHSALLVPYFSWQITHGKHHKATGNMERDMVFVPRTREQHASRIGSTVRELGELAEETPAWSLLMLFLQQLVGWPNYLVSNITGHDFHERQRESRGKGKSNGFGGGVNHFDPRSPLFDNKDAKLIILSDLGIILTALTLNMLGRTFGWQNLMVWYFLPYLWVNHWLVAITFLQHTDPSLPHYASSEWNFVRGAAATIDRDMGFIGRHLFHGIIETHVLHHYVSSIPFYNADEASDAIRPVMGKHYRADTKDGPIGFVRALWRSSRMCQWVEPSESAEGSERGILFFRNGNGIGTRPATHRES